MAWLDFLYAALVICAGAVLQTLTGVGTGFLVIPVIALIDMALLPGPMVMASMSLSGLMAYRGRAHIDYNNVGAILCGIIPGGILGALVLRGVSLDQLGLVFGVVVLLGVVLTALSLRVPLTRASGLLAGMVAGAMGASTGIGAPVLAILYQRASGPMIRATLALIYTAASALILVILSSFGQFDLERAIAAVWLMPGFVVGYFASQHLTARLDQKAGIRWLVLAMAAFAALALMVRSVM
jgi:uncharacterized membrane protein YfcA